MYERMIRTLRDVLAEFVANPPGHIGIYAIHLSRAVEREELLRRLERAVGGMDIFEGVDGKACVAAGHPTKCAIEAGLVRTAGEIGCLVSHVELMRKALREGLSHLFIFEDDCALAGSFSVGALEAYLQSVKEVERNFGFDSSDFLLFGTAGCYTWRYITDRVKATNNFNGSHAYCIGRPMMEKFIQTYEFLKLKGLVFPVDGIWGLLLRAEKKWALCPDDEKGLFIQDRTIPSYVLHDGSDLRNE